MFLVLHTFKILSYVYYFITKIREFYSMDKISMQSITKKNNILFITV